MENIRNIIIVGGEDDNPARFITELNPVKLDTDCEMALTSMYHGEVFNIDSSNNTVFFKDNTGNMHTIDLEVPVEPNGKLNLITIPEGYYNSSAQILFLIADEIKKNLRRGRRGKDPMEVSFIPETGIIQIVLNEVFLIVEKYESMTLWPLLGLQKNQNKKFNIANVNYNDVTSPVFVYASIVENSYINGNLSRNLGVVPIKNSGSFYESSYTKYVPINIKEFSKVLIELRDLKGEFIKFNPQFKTVITLHIKPIKK